MSKSQDKDVEKKRFFGLTGDGVLPFAIGAAGIAYYALQAHAPHEKTSSFRDWEKHVQTGQLVAIAALSTGVLLYRGFRLGVRVSS